ncbi:two-component sensor histidine kinase [Mangrovactinospora gilvigrisea]|uniref:histidine kinase n=2 Tax=Mangrovactinospora gilvigrisea TaxID=1428644 RepID=A0A1J7BF70_9ACTN|nr:two-component sensor histidine kinase [Mangrovactinospora gilvigrisea]
MLRRLTRRLPARSGSLRWKVSTAIAVVSFLIALALSLLLHSATHRALDDNVRSTQDDSLTYAIRLYMVTGQPGLHATLDDPELPHELRQAIRPGKRATYIDNSQSPPVAWAAADIDGHTLSTEGVMTNTQDILGDLDTYLVGGSAALVLTGTGLGLFIGERLSRRLRVAADAARTVAAGDHSIRVRDAVGGTARDETTDLANAIDSMSEALRERLEAERRVTADIAHELRTPVTGLVTAAELLPPGRPSELVQDRAKVLRTLIEDVLEVARLDGTYEQPVLSEFSLGEFVESRLAASHSGAKIEVRDEARVLTDPRRLERIIGNLVNNARKHGRPPIEVTVDGPVVRVRDHGPGFPDVLIAEGPQRFRTGRAERGIGHGLGLTIAVGQARVLEAPLVFRNHPDGGALAILDLRHARVDVPE